MGDPHAPLVGPHHALVDVEQCRDPKAAFGEPLVGSERSSEVADADDRSRPRLGKAELPSDLIQEVLDVVADAAGPVRPEIRKVLADLGGVDAGEPGELFGGHLRPPAALSEVEKSTQIDGQAAD